MNKINERERQKTEFYYKDCLRDNGLKEQPSKGKYIRFLFK